MLTQMGAVTTPSQPELNLTGEQGPVIADTPRPKSYKPFWILTLLLTGFLVIESFIPLRTTVQIGADEGFELAKATLCLNGHHLYTEVWNDQPPLHTFLITQILKHISTSVLVPRLLTVAFSLLLLSAVFGITYRISGLFVATLTTAFVIASPGFLELSSSCMLEIPGLATAMAALLVTLTPRQTKWFAAEIGAGIVFGLGAPDEVRPGHLPSACRAGCISPTTRGPQSDQRHFGVIGGIQRQPVNCLCRFRSPNRARRLSVPSPAALGIPFRPGQIV